jgi:GWxTD domain-containing protein
MRRLWYLVVVCFMAGSLFSQDIGHRKTRYGFAIDVKPGMYCDAYLIYPENERYSKLWIRLNIQYDMLQFTRVNERYQASYDVSVLIRKSGDGSPVFSTGWQESVMEADFEKTNSPRIYHSDDKAFDLLIPSATYIFYLKVTDHATQQVYINKSGVIVADLSGNKLACSEIKLLSVRDSLSTEIHIGDQRPIIEFDQSVLANFYIGSNSSDSVQIESRLYRQSGDREVLIKEQSYRLYPAAKRSVFFEGIDKNILREGSHVLRYTIRCGPRTIQLQKEFQVIWYGKPVYLYEFDLAWRPLKSILPEAEWKRVNDLSAENKKKWFDDFWSRKDPTPDTPLNEIQYEFYRRVDLANARYGLRFQEGWQTDRGYILLSSGIPDSVETNRYSSTVKPYEIWYYRSLKKKVIFVDVDRDENYKLSVIEDIEENKDE